MKAFFTKYKYHLIWSIIIIAVLAGAYFYGGDTITNAPYQENNTAEVPVGNVQESSTNTTLIEDTESGNESIDDTLSAEDGVTSAEATADSENTVPDTPDSPEDTPEEPETNSCTIYIDCKTILNNMGDLAPGKEELIPADGIILTKLETTLNDGETVFDVLQRVTREQGIHLEYVHTPAYDSAYIEGLFNLYEFDCGPLSGWRYSVNGIFPGYGCSMYTLKDGDEIRWIYTCNLGRDIQ